MNKRRHNSAGLSLKKDKWLSNQRGPLLMFTDSIALVV
jgi:hypothetical protein